ncbi:MAG: L-threonylcarbamoyladenylate synthase [Melioribacteraceae bacterium]
MKLLKATNRNISLAAKLLKTNGLVAFPTETVYGLGANGLSAIAVAKIFEAKERPIFNPLILHVSSIEMLNSVADVNNSKIEKLITKFWPGPLTLVLPKKNIVPELVTAGLETVAVRMPNNKTALDLIEKLGKPIAAPSANLFGQLSPTKAIHVKQQLGNRIDLILDGGDCSVGVESTIVNILAEENLLLRPGGIAKEEIELEIGELIENNKSSTPNSPGQLKIHYAPTVPTYFFDEEKIKAQSNKKNGGLFFQDSKFDDYFSYVKILSTSGNLNEAASNLFSSLHYLENKNLDMIFVEPIELKGLGIAIMDRLTKAVNKYL